MISMCERIARRLANLRLVLGTLFALTTAATVFAATVIYEYDDAGRLKLASYDDGSQIEYVLDAAGNRTAVKTRIAPGQPGISDQTTWHPTGNFTVSWTAPTGTAAVTRYELYEAFNGGAFAATPVFNALGTSYPATNRAEGRYTYRVRGCNAEGCGLFATWSNPFIVDLTAPTQVAYMYATDVSATSAVLSWNAADDNFELQNYEYRLQPSTAWIGHGLSQVVNLTGLTPQTEYIAETRARDRAGNAGALRSVTFTTLTSVPFAPVNLNALHVANCAWTGSWSAVPGATSYTFRATNGTETANITTTSFSISCPNNDPEANKPDWVRACNANGCSGRSNFGTSDTSPPTQPGAFSYNTITHNSAAISWGGASDDVGVWAYDYRLNGSPTWITVGTAFVNLTGLTLSTPYTIEVRASDAVGHYGPSRTGNFTTLGAPDTDPPGPPGSVTITGIQSTQVTVNWTAATDNVGVTGYRYKLTIVSPWNTPVGITSSGLLTGLTPSTQYTVEVQARDATGNWGVSRNSAQFTTAIGAPPSPTGLAYNQVADCAWRATWYQSANATSYIVRDTNGVELPPTTELLQYVNCPQGNPQANKPRYVRACNASGCSANSAFDPAPNTDTTKPSQPGAINFPAITATTATANWGASTDNIAVTSYEYQLGSQQPVNIGLATTVNLGGLTGSTSYAFTVRARDFAGNASDPTSTTLTTSDITAPTQPGVVTFSLVTTNSARATWGISTDNVGVTGYEYRLGTAEWTPLGLVTSVDLSGLSQATTYTFEVRARDLAGYASLPRSAPLTTVTPPPGAPVSIGVPSTSSNGSISLSWVGPSSGTATSYQVYEATNASFSGESSVYDNTGTGTVLSGRQNGSYWYRVRACNVGGCSGFIVGGPTVVTLLPGIPTSVSAPATAFSTYLVTWGGSSGIVVSYEIQGSRNDPSFGGVVWGGTSTDTSATINPTLEGSYYYRVRACNVSGCGGWATRASPTVVIFPPGAPSVMNVPSSTTNGAFTISWGAASGTSPSYEVYEAYNPSFTGETSVYSGTGSSFAFSNKPSTTYYYRVRACNVAGCSGFTAGANGVVSAWPPGVMSAINVPWGYAGATFTVGWGYAGGQVTSYELFEATNSSFSGEVLVFSGAVGSGPATLTRGNGTYYYRVRACNTFPGNCGPALAASNPVTVVLPPGTPSFISVPPTSTGNHTVSWGAPSGTYDSYSLYETLNPNWASYTQVYSGPNTSVNLTGRATGTYYYRVLSSYLGVTGGYATGSNPTVVNTPPPIPGAPQNLRKTPTSGNGRTYTILWDAVTTGAAVNHYTLTEKEVSTLPPTVTPYTIPAGTTSKAFSWPATTFAQFEYTLRACASANETACSGESNGVPKTVCPTSGCP